MSKSNVAAKKSRTLEKKLTKQLDKPPTKAVAPPGVGAVGSVSAGQVGDAGGKQLIARPPVRELALSVFKDAPNEEFSANSVIERLKVKHPAIIESSVRFMIGELKKANQVHRVRNDGHIAILKFGPNPKDKAFLPKHSTNSTVNNVTGGNLQGDLAMLNEVTAVITKLEKFVHRNREIVTHISKLKAVL
jgi:hypothetical protein